MKKIKINLNEQHPAFLAAKERKVELEQDLDDIIKDLTYFDWFYDYSDDHSVWKRGVAAKNALRSKVVEFVKSERMTSDEVKNAFKKSFNPPSKEWEDEIDAFFVEVNNQLKK